MKRSIIVSAIALILTGCIGGSQSPSDDGWEISETSAANGGGDQDAGVDIAEQQDGVVVHPSSERERIRPSDVSEECESGQTRFLMHIKFQLRVTTAREDCHDPAEYAPTTNSSVADLYLRFPNVSPTWHKFEVDQREDRSDSPRLTWVVRMPNGSGDEFLVNVSAFIGSNVSVGIYGEECMSARPIPAERNAEALLEQFGNVEMRVEKPEEGFSKSFFGATDLESAGFDPRRYRVWAPVYAICELRVMPQSVDE